MSELAKIPVPPKRAEAKHKNENRTFQGIPLIGISPKGRLFAGWYTGGVGECCENYVGLAISDDRGETWSDLEWVIDPPAESVRAFDATMWLSPDQTLYLFWSQCVSRKINDVFDGENGVWYSILKNPDDPVADFQWTPPVRIADGVMMNKPFVMSDGTWGLPVSLWTHRDIGDPSKNGAKIVVSTDHGKTFVERGKVICDPDWASYDEHAIIELPDGRLKMLIRCRDGFQESFSSDKGYTWTPPVKSGWQGPNSKPCFAKLASGNYMMTGNDSATRRENMTAWFLKDGCNRESSLLLDERAETSYPDMVQDREGTIYIINDFNRYKGGYIYVSRIHEDDLEAGKIVNPDSRLLMEVSHTRPVPQNK